LVNGQESDISQQNFTFDFSPFYGNIYLHNPSISHLITSHPTGFVLGLNKKSFGEKEWQAEYGYPDSGVTFLYQDMQNSTLGKHYGLYAHYNFYLLNRNIQLRVAHGLAYNTNPYDRNGNFRNNAYGSHILSSTAVLINYHKEKIWQHLGVKAGLTLVHYSNGNFKAPNTSTNTVALNMGLVYNLEESDPDFIPIIPKEKISEGIKLNVVARAGVNETDVIGLGQYGFLIFSTYADKRLGNHSAIQLGGDMFYSHFLKPLIQFQSISFPELGVAADTDYKRAGIFVGHELFVNKLSVITQLGYYVYYPYDFEGRVYNRIGLKRYFGNKFFGALTLKSHAAKAEAVEFGIGVRL
jgi:hypothetical protein